jgi:hypothetical protein
MRGTRKGNKAHIARPDYTEGLEGGKIHAPARNGRTRFERLEAAVRSAEKKQDIESQHGPVKVLVKDGKPVRQE